MLFLECMYGDCMYVCMCVCVCMLYKYEIHTTYIIIIINRRETCVYRVMEINRTSSLLYYYFHYFCSKRRRRRRKRDCLLLTHRHCFLCAIRMMMRGERKTVSKFPNLYTHHDDETPPPSSCFKRSECLISSSVQGLINFGVTYGASERLRQCRVVRIRASRERGEHDDRREE
jgi:hypothetical protein